MKWHLKEFRQLSLEEFHDILKLRIEVFVVEQNCPYGELDGKDHKALHCFATDKKGKIIAYTRIFKPGQYYKEAAFGRVLVAEEFRSKKIGYQLIEQTLIEIRQLFGGVDIKIGAQAYLKAFYENFGFEKIGKDYLEDGIPHIYMLKRGQAYES